MTQMLEEFQFTIRSLAEHRGRKGFHDLFDRDGSATELILGGTDEAERAHTDRLQVDIAGGDLEDLRASEASDSERASGTTRESEWERQDEHAERTWEKEAGANDGSAKTKPISVDQVQNTSLGG